MCLQLPHSPVPYNDSSIRWKVLRMTDLKLYSMIFKCRWNVGSFKRAVKIRRQDGLVTPDHDVGLHVFVTKKDATAFALSGNDNLVVVKVGMGGFKMAGTYPYWTRSMDEYVRFAKCEVWKRAFIIQVFNRSGRTDITNRFC